MNPNNQNLIGKKRNYSKDNSNEGRNTKEEARKINKDIIERRSFNADMGMNIPLNIQGRDFHGKINNNFERENQIINNNNFYKQNKDKINHHSNTSRNNNHSRSPSPSNQNHLENFEYFNRENFRKNKKISDSDNYLNFAEKKYFNEKEKNSIGKNKRERDRLHQDFNNYEDANNRYDHNTNKYEGNNNIRYRDNRENFKLDQIQRNNFGNNLPVINPNIPIQNMNNSYNKNIGYDRKHENNFQNKRENRERKISRDFQQRENPNFRQHEDPSNFNNNLRMNKKIV